MRITNKQIFLISLQNVTRPARRMLDNQVKISSGKRINHFYDDPMGAGQVRQLRGEKADVVQFQRNISSGLNWMQMTEGALDRLEKNLIRAKALAVQAANSSNGRSERQTIGKEMNQILEDVLSIANSQFRSKYIFAGKNTTSQPFVEVRDKDGNISSITLANDTSGKIQRDIDTGVKMQVNIPGSDIFNLKDGPFATLLDLRKSLENNDIDGINKALDQIENVLDTSLNARTLLGARMNRLESTRSLLQTHEVDLATQISNIEDADIAETAMRLASDEVSYRAALGASSRILQTSLVDLLT
ncbi:MAG: flagellar hook-associated protein 3 [Calditrichaeota bacterium]|nr:MAG: flagellar hook-associated protein 3 [Calditrichota bacterium]